MDMSVKCVQPRGDDFGDFNQHLFPHLDDLLKQCANLTVSLEAGSGTLLKIMPLMVS